MGMSLYDCAVYTIREYNLHNEKPEAVVIEWKNSY